MLYLAILAIWWNSTRKQSLEDHSGFGIRLIITTNVMSITMEGTQFHITVLPVLPHKLVKLLGIDNIFYDFRFKYF